MKKSIVITTPGARFSAVVFRENFDESIRKVAKLGYEGVELAIRDPEMVNVRSIKKTVDTYRLQVPAVGTGQAYGEEGLSFSSPDKQIRERAVARMKKHIEFSSQLGAQVIIGLIRGRIEENVNAKLAKRWVLDTMRECGKVAEESGIKLTLEPLNRYETNIINTVEEAIQFIEKSECQNVGLLVDTFHMNIEEASICKSIERARDYLTHVHIADSNRWAPGWGHIDFAEILNTLKKIEYRGYVSAEILPLPDPEAAARQTTEYLKELNYNFSR